MFYLTQNLNADEKSLRDIKAGGIFQKPPLELLLLLELSRAVQPLLSLMSHPCWFLFMELFPSNTKFLGQLIQLSYTKSAEQQRYLRALDYTLKSLIKSTSCPLSSHINNPVSTLQPGPSLPAHNHCICWTCNDFSRGLWVLPVSVTPGILWASVQFHGSQGIVIVSCFSGPWTKEFLSKPWHRAAKQLLDPIVVENVHFDNY